MRKLRPSLTVFAAVLYVLLGINAAWHAPHFSRGAAAVQTDSHAADHEQSFGDEGCALCSWKTVSQESASPGSFAPRAHTVTTAQRPVAKVPAGGFLRAARARAPPLLS